MPVTVHLAQLTAFKAGVERTKAARYTRLSERLSAVGNSDAAEVFAALAHDAHDAAMGISGDNGTVEYLLDALPQLVDDNDIDDLGGVYLLASYRCYQLAVYDQMRLLDHVVHMSADTSDPTVRTGLDDIANQIIAELKPLRAKRRTAYRAQRAIFRRPEPPQVDNLGQFESYQRDRAALETQIRARQADLLTDPSDAPIKTFFQTQSGSTQPPPSPQIAAQVDKLLLAAPLPSDGFEALRAALHRIDRMYRRYAALATKTTSESVLKQAHICTAETIDEIARIKAIMHNQLK